MIVLIVTVGALSSLAYSRMQVPSYEASAVVQTLPGVDVEAAKARSDRTRQLLAMVHAPRHRSAGESVPGGGAVAPVDRGARPDVEAGGTLGLEPEISGIVVSVLWPDAETSARLANDLAQQILDAGNEGNWTQSSARWSFTAARKQRLWQEIGAMTGRTGGGQSGRGAWGLPSAW